jgi:hypothetical protein
VAKQIRRFDEKSTSVPVQAGLELSGEWIEAAPVYVIVVADVARCAGIRSSTKQELGLGIRFQRVEVNSTANKKKTRELISGFEREDVLVKRQQTRVVSCKSLLREIQIEVEWPGRLIVNIHIHAE